MLAEEEKRILSETRFDRAKECLDEAQALLALERYKGAINRSYYAVFHAMRAVLALDGIDRKRHSGIISEFQRRYIKTGIFEKNTSDLIADQFEYRTSSDYDDFYIVSKSEAVSLITSAEHFLTIIEQHLKL